MADPARLPDRPAQRGDDYTMRLIFQFPNGTAKDVSGANWEMKSVVPWQVDVSQAFSGIVEFTVRREDMSASLPPYVRWDLAEHNLWGRTVMRGRLDLDVAGAVAVDGFNIIIHDDPRDVFNVVVSADNSGSQGLGTGQPRFVGEGPPPDLIIGSQPGDEYLDNLSGNIWQLQ